MLLVFGGYFLWSGLLRFLNERGDIAAPVTQQAANATDRAQAAFTESADQVSIAVPTSKPTQTCLDFRVNVVKARVRECAKDTCTVLDDLYSQGQLVCVYRPAPGATDWYEINLRPDAVFPLIAYMHSSVLDAVNPTRRPTRTFTPLPTVSPVPTARPTRTLTPTASPSNLQLSATAKTTSAGTE
jgi:hypothetical protein